MSSSQQIAKGNHQQLSSSWQRWALRQSCKLACSYRPSQNTEGRQTSKFLLVTCFCISTNLSLFLIPIAVVNNLPQTSWLKTHIYYGSAGRKYKTGLTCLKSNCQQNFISSAGSRAESLNCLFQLL